MNNSHRPTVSHSLGLKSQEKVESKSWVITKNILDKVTVDESGFECAKLYVLEAKPRDGSPLVIGMTNKEKFEKLT